ncbi:hypothetical protein [Cupriavidus oxalaticus]|uniref:hypothetical protein n=1 Tax=Cupriavidus oxalaticus TaxID=96344 RepID=UPI001F0E480A|nr:hypothetical protein [Cupriavidus oxalaticus]
MAWLIRPASGQGGSDKDQKVEIGSKKFQGDCDRNKDKKQIHPHGLPPSSSDESSFSKAGAKYGPDRRFG